MMLTETQFFREPINKSITPQQGKMIIFAGHIYPYAEKSYKQKEILVEV